MNTLLQTAIRLAKAHPHKKLKAQHACILVGHNGVYHGYNRPKSHPLQKKFGRNVHSIWLHAEMDAIVQALRNNEDLSKSSLYVARIYKNGKVGPSKPCKGCQQAIDHFMIPYVEYT